MARARPLNCQVYRGGETVAVATLRSILEGRQLVKWQGNGGQRTRQIASGSGKASIHFS
ncbi:MAG: hypothetical protein WHS83_15210 [Chloroflexus sp.]|uniref:hypothetical protein n=1 Tax=Chloroflexus sp. TaxID=1904827 RepID=UPI0030B2C135